MIDAKELDRLEGLEKKATAEPWDNSPASVERQFCAQVWNSEGMDLAWLYPKEQSSHDAAFIAAARNALPALIAAAREAIRLRDELRTVCKRALNYSEHVVFNEGVYFDDDDDLPAIRAVLDTLQPSQPGGVG